MNIITPTNDGSNTLFNESIGEHYHSAHGALQESRHVFIDAGLVHALKTGALGAIEILEVGFGTGLNFLLTYAFCDAGNIKLSYTGIEAFPLPLATISNLGYNEYVPDPIWEIFSKHYEQALVKNEVLSSSGELQIVHQKLAEFKSEKKFDLLYYDAFSVRHQPEMWTDDQIALACSFLKVGGTFVSYAITGNLKRALKKCGLAIEKLPGAPGKREMIRGTKINENEL